MTAYLVAIGIAVLLGMFGLWNRREIRRGRDVDQAFIYNDLKSGWLKISLGNFDYFSKVTMPLAVAAITLFIGTHRFLDRG